MPAGRKRIDIANERNIFAQNAAAALEVMVNGPNRDKLIARMFNVSVRMAQYLRAGECWTVERLSIASALLGEEFNKFLVAPGSVGEQATPKPKEDIHDRLDRFEQRIARELEELRNDLRRRGNLCILFAGGLLSCYSLPLELMLG